MTIIGNVIFESTKDIKAFDTPYSLKFILQEKEVIYMVQNPFTSLR